MANTGNIFPGTGANDAGIGATAWVNPGNIVSDNAVDASCTAAASSQYLVAKNFNFASVPTNATIAGVTVRIEAAESSTGSETLNVRLQDEAGALTGTGKTASINGTSPVVYTLGSVSDLWSATVTPAKVHDIDWGVRFWYTTAHNMTVDYITMALEYTTPPPGVTLETDTALALGKVKRRAIGVCSETATALALTKKKLCTTGLTVESSSAFALTPRKIRATGFSSSTEAALACGRRKIRALGLSADSENALALLRVKIRALGASSELDTALALERGSNSIQLPVGCSIETDAVLSLLARKLRSIGPSLEAAAALAPARCKLRAAASSSTADAALALARLKYRAYAPAVELSSVQALALLIIPQAVFRAAPAKQTAAAPAFPRTCFSSTPERMVHADPDDRIQ